jgi:hypothetical protein
LVEQPLDTLVDATANKLEREWPRALARIASARELFVLNVRVAEITYRTIRWICADKPPNPFRRVEYAISIPPLNRTILESIFTTLFVLEDIPSRSKWYLKAGWREERLELDRYLREYADLEEWKVWLERFSKHVEMGIHHIGISQNEVSDPELIPRWPNPGSMVRYGIKRGHRVPPNRMFLHYLNDWFYRDLSGQSHLDGLGLMKRAGFLLSDHRRDEATVTMLQQFKHDQVGMAITLVLALVSEIEAQFGFGLADRAKYLWKIIVDSMPIAQEIHEKRYSRLL